MRNSAGAVLVAVVLAPGVTAPANAAVESVRSAYADSICSAPDSMVGNISTERITARFHEYHTDGFLDTFATQNRLAFCGLIVKDWPMYAFRLDRNVVSGDTNAVTIAAWLEATYPGLLRYAEGAGDKVVDGVRDPSPVPRALLTATPNPFNATVRIRFQTVATGPVAILVSDVAGRLVRRLVSGTGIREGSHTITWDGTDDAGRPVATGVYLLGLAASGRLLALKRVTLLR